MLDAGLIASRLAHYLAVLSLFGAALYPLYAFRQGAQSIATDVPILARQMRWILSVSVALALLSGMGWFVFTAGAMAGDLSQTLDSDLLKAMVDATDFGPLWIARLLLLVLITALLARWPLKPAHWALPLLASFLVASLAGTGHAQATAGWTGVLHQASDAAHLLAAGIWLGGLWPLGMVIVASKGDRDASGNQWVIGEVLTRFSGVGTFAVAILVASGMVNSWFLVGTPGALFSTTYGLLLLLKLVLFLIMVLLASANRFWLTPKLNASPTSEIWIARLRSHVFGEQVLGLLVVGLVSLLGTLEPAITH